MIVIIPLIIVIGILAWVLRPVKEPTTPYKVSILFTVIPALLVAIAAVAFQLLHNAGGTTIEVAEISNTLFVVGLGLIGAYIITAIGFAVLRKGQVAKGIAFGVCLTSIISIIDLGLLEWFGGV